MCRKTEKVESKKETAADDEGGLGSMAAAVGSFFVFISLFFSEVQWEHQIKGAANKREDSVQNCAIDKIQST